MAEDLPLSGKVHRRPRDPGQKRGVKVGTTKQEQGTKRMVVVAGQGSPAGNLLAPASLAEVALEAGDRRGKRCSANGKLGDTQP